MRKRIFTAFTILLFTLIVFTISGFYLMEIDDHYGNLQQIYFECKSGDLIVNKDNNKFGIISKNWKRALIVTNKKDTLDLYEFIHQDKYEVLRTENELTNNLTINQIIDLKKNNSFKTIITN
ncbi:hypothetical protein [Flavobacterium foetidum]|uniref:hypothetical protein n=1 Tax=Flavobacterium foetidum TaxID=2026681 RepID=UPI001074B5F0|nr:hypothetical protein [Flavobacterium foetidum]KAF2517932.1 hypothetical protein E0W73_01600 [Flavobacterium foetidum]